MVQGFQAGQGAAAPLGTPGAAVRGTAATVPERKDEAAPEIGGGGGDGQQGQSWLETHQANPNIRPTPTVPQERIQANTRL
jgi:hypothetical protein